MWLTEATPVQRRALVAASLGWMLDSMDVMLYSLVLTHLMADLGMSKTTAGLLSSLTLLSSAVGGTLFGLLADRAGRRLALTWSILVYSVFTAACGLAGSVGQLAVFRVLLGLGFGGEWASGAALVAETWPARHRGKALGLMQSSWAIGYAAAAVVAAAILPRFGWRAVFFAGVVPALGTLWIRRHVPEPEIWNRSRQERRSGSQLAELRALFGGKHRRNVLVTTLANAGTMFGVWGLLTWIPAYLSTPVSSGGRGLDIVRTSSWIVVMQAGAWLGYVSFGFVADAIGRVKTYAGYILAAAVMVPLYTSVRDETLLLLLGPVVGFFGHGYFSGFGAITAELFPTAVRASAQGFIYNLGRGISAAGPLAIGALSMERGLGVALQLTSGAFLIAGLVALLIPETKGRELE
jgi:MFS family permease